MKTRRRPAIVPPLVLALPRRTLRGLVTAAPLFLLVALCVPAASVLAADTPSGGETSDAAPPDENAAASRETQAGASSTVRPEVAERLLVANRYLEDGKPDDALAVVDELAAIRKLKSADRAQLHRFRGYILIAKNRTDDAGREFEAALAENALDDSARQGLMYSLAQIYTQAGRYDRARELLDRWFAAAENPKPEAWFLRAMVLVQQEAFADALEPARTAVEQSPDVRESWLQLLAAIQFQLQDYAGLAGTLKRLVAVAPGTKRYWVQLAAIENAAGRDDEALATLGIAYVAGLLREDKEIRQRARQCFVRDLPAVCARTLEDGLATARVQQDAEAYQLLANCYIAARETDKAIAPLQRAGELSSNGKALLMLGQLQLQKERFDDARAALVRARGKSEAAERPSIDLLIGIAALGAGAYDEAESAFATAEGDDRTRAAAASYRKHLQQVRALRELRSGQG